MELGTSDDVSVTLQPQRYYAGDQWVTIEPQDAPLGADHYRLRISNGVKNPFGKPIVEYSRDFYVTSGGTGDIIAVDLQALFGGTHFAQLALLSVAAPNPDDPGYAISNPAGSPQEHVMSDGTRIEPVGQLFRSDELIGTSFTDTGQFYFAPSRTRI